MKLLIASIVVLAVVVSAQTPPPKPNIAASFSAAAEIRANFTVDGRTEHVTGRARYARDAVGKKFFEEARFENARHRRFERTYLARWDLMAAFEINNEDKCTKTALTGAMPEHLPWLKDATYDGRREFNGRLVDAWGYLDATSGIRHEVAVLVEDSSFPRWFGYFNTKTREYSQHLIDFYSPRVPSANDFTIPTGCA